MFVVMLMLWHLHLTLKPCSRVFHGGYGAASDKVPASSLKYAAHLKSKSSKFYFLKFNTMFMLKLVNWWGLSFSSVRRKNGSCYCDPCLPDPLLYPCHWGNDPIYTSSICFYPGRFGNFLLTRHWGNNHRHWGINPRYKFDLLLTLVIWVTL